MNPTKHRRLLSSLNTMERKVYDTTPIGSGVSIGWAVARLAEKGANPNYRVVEVCMKNLVRAGLVKENPAGDYSRVPVKKHERRTLEPPQPATQPTQLQQEKVVPSKPTSRKKNALSFPQRMVVAQMLMKHPRLTRAELLAKTEEAVDFTVTLHNVESVAKDIGYRFKAAPNVATKVAAIQQMRTDNATIAKAVLTILDALEIEVHSRSRASLERIAAHRSDEEEGEGAP